MPPPASVPRNTSSGTTAGQAASAPPPGSVAGPSPTSQVPSPQVAAPVSGNATPAGPTMTVGDVAAREIVVETTKVRAVFSNRGANVVHWILKEFRNDAGQPLDLVPGAAGDATVKPFTLTVDDQATTARLNSAIYRVTVNGNPVADTVDATASPQTIVFEAAASDGLNVKKTFSLEPTSYVINFGATVQAGGKELNPTIQLGPGLGDDIARTPPSSFFSPATSLPPRAIVYRDGDVDRLDPSASGSQEGPFRYVGVDDHYFAAVLLNDEPARPVRIEYQPQHVPLANDPTIIGKYVTAAVRFAAPPVNARFFYGPKVFEELREIDPELDARDPLRHVLVARGAAARRAQVGAGICRQLGLVDRRADHPDQPGDVPVAPQERGVDAEDAGNPAADEGDPGALRQVQGHRPRAAEDEHRGDGSCTSRRASTPPAAVCRCSSHCRS